MPGFNDDIRRRHEEFDRNWKRTSRLMGAWFVFVAVVSLALLGFGVWVVVQLVEWIKSK